MFHQQLFYRVACDVCGKAHEGYEYDWWSEESEAEEDAQSDGWQIIDGQDDNPSQHHCPEHWQLTCPTCGHVSDAEPLKDLGEEGWKWPYDPEDTLCPACSQQKQEQTNGTPPAEAVPHGGKPLGWPLD